MISKAAKQRINEWLDTLQEGDKIVVHGDYITLYNSCGCELDTVTMSGYQVHNQFND